MDYLPCDQFAADLLETQREVAKESGVPLKLEIEMVEVMVEELEKRRTRGDDQELLESVLGGHEFRHNVEYSAYKRLLEKITKRRIIYRQQQNTRRGKFAPFAQR